MVTESDNVVRPYLQRKTEGPSGPSQRQSMQEEWRAIVGYEGYYMVTVEEVE
jgi:hypothetical protein